MNLPASVTPAEFARQYGWSERRVRDKARELGACRIMGNRMVLLPEDVQALLEAGPNLVKGRTECVVYFAAVRGFIKIGWSENWRLRLSNLQVANPEPIEVLLVLGRPKIFEATLHKQFAQHRSHGEWFRDHPDIRIYIESRKDECWHVAGRYK